MKSHNNPLITAVIPTYKRPEKFRRALESVLAQIVSPARIIVGDDGHDEEIEDICKSYGDSRIVYIARHPKLRMTENWDFVMRYPADGLVALLEDDNIWLPHHLANASKLFNRFPDAGLYHAGHQEAWDLDGKLEIYKTFYPPWHEELNKDGGGSISSKNVVLDALTGGSINSSTVVVRRAVLNGMPPFDSRYLMGMDTLMWTRIAIYYQCVYGPSLDTIYIYHRQNVSAMEVANRRAGFQARSSRRLIANEALEKGIITQDIVCNWLFKLPPEQAASVITIFSHVNTDIRLRRIAKYVWKIRTEVQYASGFLKASRILGFWVIGQADRIDVILGKYNKTKMKLIK